MLSLRQLFLASLPILTVACGGGDDGATPPSGPINTSVVNSVTVPKNSNEARDIGLDLDGDKLPDNRLGDALAVLGQQGFDLDGAISDALNLGDISLLVELQTPDFTATTGAGITVKLGDMPMPDPCTGGDETMPETCGAHLEGTGTFALAAGSPAGVAVEGKIVGGVFNGGPGEFTLQLSLAGATLDLQLIGARAKATGMSADGIDVLTLAGALPQEALDSDVLPAIHSAVSDIVAEDCAGAALPDCVCPAGGESTGDQVLGIFDNMPKDCTISLDEIKNSAIVSSLLEADVELEGVKALSLGLNVSTVKASFR